MGNIRALLLATDLELGGLPLRLAKLAPRLRAAGVEPTVGCLAKAGPVSRMLDAAGVETFTCVAINRFDLRCVGRLVEEIRRRDPDLVHSFLCHANVAARLTGRLDRARPVVTSTVTIEIERPLHRWLEAVTLSLSDWHVVNSQAVATHVREDLGADPSHVVVLPNAIDLETIRRTEAARRTSLGIPETSTVVVWAGRMDPVKDLTTWVRAVAVARDRGLEMHGVLMGDGPARGETLRLIETLGLGSVVRWLGWQSDVIGYMKMSDILLLTSRTEGSSNTLWEALASGCAVVASDLAPCREALTGLSFARCCPVGDVYGFADALWRFQSWRKSGFCEGKATIAAKLEELDLPRIASRWGDFYRKVMWTYNSQDINLSNRPGNSVTTS